MTNKRTETAREHDDSDLIDAAAATPTPDQQGRAGGDMETRVGARDERRRLDDPDATTGVDKSDEKGTKGFKPNETKGSG